MAGTPAGLKGFSERRIIFLVGAVQFVNILDFMMVMPMGPDFGRALGISNAKLPMIGGAYTAAAAVSGIICALFLDRFDRRKALAVAMAGLALGTLAGAFAVDLPSLMTARIVAGIFGGPATSVALSIIADVIPPERRGRAMGAVMGAFSVASVLGVPMGLELARQLGWQAPFIVVAGLGALITAATFVMLPPLTLHLEARAKEAHHVGFGELFGNRMVWWSYALTATVMMAGFVVIPSISPYLQFNLHYPRKYIGLLYMAGGAVSFGAMRLVGWLVDRHGSFKIGAIGSLLLMPVVYVGFAVIIPGVPVVGVFIGFMLAMSFRNVAYNTLVSKVPSPAERARFMSVQSAVQHMASAIAAIMSSPLLHELEDHSLRGMTNVAYVSIGLSALVIPLLWAVESKVRARARSAQRAEEQLAAAVALRGQALGGQQGG